MCCIRILKGAMCRVLIALITLVGTLAQDRNCDFSQQVLPGKTYYVYSPGYPAAYAAGVTCRWLARCPPGHSCRLECPLVDLPETQGCSSDHLLVSRRGDPQLTAAERYCGEGALQVDSRGPKLSIGLVTYSSSTYRGKFYCRLSARPDTGNNTCICGVRNAKRIVNGKDATAGEYPMMAGLTDRRVNQVYCGGTIVSNQYVVTAAHCRLDLKIKDIGVVVGKLYTEDDKNEVVYPVREFRVHPKYDESTYSNDIALVRTSTIKFDFGVSPACLPFRYRDYDFTGEKVTALGWGTLFPGGPTAAVLQKVDLDVISDQRCRETEDASDQNMCTYTRGKDSCQFDSGGPLLYTDRSSGRQYLAGVVSHGYSCASDRPGVNTRLTEMLGWILDNAKADFCKL